LGNDKDINIKDKRSHKEAIQQEKAKFSETKVKRQHVVGDQ